MLSVGAFQNLLGILLQSVRMKFLKHPKKIERTRIVGPNQPFSIVGPNQPFKLEKSYRSAFGSLRNLLDSYKKFRSLPIRNGISNSIVLWGHFKEQTKVTVNALIQSIMFDTIVLRLLFIKSI